MYIIDQGENELVNLDKMTNIAVTSDEDERWFVVAYNVYGASYNLGYYADHDKAKAALYDIYQQMNTNAKVLYAPKLSTPFAASPARQRCSQTESCTQCSPTQCSPMAMMNEWIDDDTEPDEDEGDYEDDDEEPNYGDYYNQW